MFAQAEQDVEAAERRSIFDWVERPLSTVSIVKTDPGHQISHFKAQACRRQEPGPSTIISFAFEPSQQPLGKSKKRVKLYQNTYHLEPLSFFKPHLIEPTMCKMLASSLQDKVYSSEEAPTLCKFLADEIKQKAKKLNFKRFKLITEVMIGEKKQQGIVTASRFLWDETRDNYASVKYENQSLFAVAVIYALNFE